MTEIKFDYIYTLDGLTIICRAILPDGQQVQQISSWADVETAYEFHEMVKKSFEELFNKRRKRKRFFVSA